MGQVLSLLKEIDNPAYENLSKQFRTYAACVGLVDTGYFKKRSFPSKPPLDKGYKTPTTKDSDENIPYLVPFERKQRFDPREELINKNMRKINVDRLKKWLYGPYRNYMNSYYLRWNLLWPLVNEE